MKKIYPQLNKQHGLAAIELTIILPFLLFLLFATAEFGRLLYQYNALTKTVRDATRFATSHASPGTTGVVDLSQIESEIALLLRFGQLSTGTLLLPEADQDEVLSVTSSTDGDLITINVTYQWQPIFADFIPNFMGGNEIDLGFPIRTQYTMRVIDV
ncbi:TadE family protein [Thalassotalea litorea]|uniref:TadE family protein n=1 Tax=Thalassotalea litorea TaxID=2020715 RepID=UPI003736CDD1